MHASVLQELAQRLHDAPYFLRRRLSRARNRRGADSRDAARDSNALVDMKLLVTLALALAPPRAPAWRGTRGTRRVTPATVTGTCLNVSSTSSPRDSPTSDKVTAHSCLSTEIRGPHAQNVRDRPRLQHGLRPGGVGADMAPSAPPQPDPRASVRRKSSAQAVLRRESAREGPARGDKDSHGRPGRLRGPHAGPRRSAASWTSSSTTAGTGVDSRSTR